MANIFLSYASQDRDRVQPIVEALEDDGFTVWWDREIRPGPSFDREIEKALAEAACLVVVWSAQSVESEWVRSEVDEGARRGILVPVMLDDALPPLAYRRRQAANLGDWTGERDGEYAKLLAGIRATLEADTTAAGADAPTPTSASHGAGPQAPARRRWRRVVPTRTAAMAGVGAMLVAALIGWAVGQRDQRPQPVTAEPIQFEVPYPPGTTVAGNILQPMAITPDGRSLVFLVDRRSGGEEYRVRRLDQIGTRSLGVPGDDLGSIWAAGQEDWLVYNDVTSARYHKVRLDGGAPVALSSTGTGEGGDGIRGLAWSSDGRIVFASGLGGLKIMPAAGGEPTHLTTPEDGEIHSHPSWTQDNRAVLFTATPQDADPMVHAVDAASGTVTALIAGSYPRATSSGHLLVLRDNVLWASAFDAASLAVRGDAVPVTEGLAARIFSYDISRTGTLVYEPSVEGSEPEAELVRIGLDASVEVLPVKLPSVFLPRQSPDGSSILMTSNALPMESTGALDFDIWRHQLDTATTTKVTFSSTITVSPHWLPDSRRFLFVEINDDNTTSIQLGHADGARAPEVLVAKGIGYQQPVITRDGSTLVFLECTTNVTCDLAHRTIDGGETKPLLTTPFDERTPELSPDSRWLAYTSDASGQRELYLRPYPAVDSARWQVSTNGGAVPQWSADGEVLYYVEPSTERLMAVPVQPGDTPGVGAPKPLLDLSAYDWGVGPAESLRNFEVSPDGQHLLLTRRIRGPVPFVVVANWLTALKRQVPLAE